jgi:hypothetical protein
MDEWMKFCQSIGKKFQNESTNFHGIKFIHEIMVARRDNPWASCSQINNELGIPFTYSLKRKTRVFLMWFDWY